MSIRPSASVAAAAVDGGSLGIDLVDASASAEEHPPGNAPDKPAVAAQRTVMAIRHVFYQDLGAFEELLRARGFRVRYFDIGVGDLGSADFAQPDLLVVLGGPLRAYDIDKYPFLKKEIAVLEARLAAGRPCFGVGLGAHLMARALGARVYPGEAFRIGWAPLTLTPAGAASPLRHLVGPVLHWHFDAFDLPAGTELLASSEACENEAFAFGSHGLAMQFHVEGVVRKFERWLISRAPEIAAAPGLSITRLRADTARLARVTAAQGQRCLAEWLDQIQDWR